MTSGPGEHPMEPSADEATTSRQHELFADLAELVLSLAREISLHGGTEDGLVPLTATEIHALRYVRLHPGARSKGVARGIGLQRSNFSLALRSLKDKGMVSVVPDGRDGRSTRLFQTDLAARNFAHHRARWAAFLATALRDRVDVRACLEVLTQIDDALDAMRPEPDQAPS